jgi:hypothetical protein
MDTIDSVVDHFVQVTATNQDGTQLSARRCDKRAMVSHNVRVNDR